MLLITERFKKRIIFLGFFLTLTCSSLIFSSSAFAKLITINGQKIIDHNTTYENTTLDLSQGSFLIKNNATLMLRHTQVNAVISSTNPNLIVLESGQLSIRKSNFTIQAQNVYQNPTQPSLYPCIKVSQGRVYLEDNRFSIDKRFTASLLYTDRFPTSGFVITNNELHNFHGGIFLTNSNHDFIANNHFYNISLSNIFTKNSSDNLYKNNTILYSANNGLDVIDSANITLSNNYISLSSCYSMFILRSQNLQIDHNIIMGGITYAISIVPTIGPMDVYAKQLLPLVDKNILNADQYKSKNIRIYSNYISQNRYGLATTNLNGLDVKDNVFIQKFANDNERKFWTDNDLLLQDTVNVNWNANTYKEAYTQVFAGDNDKAFTFVNFPQHGGVSYHKTNARQTNPRIHA